jgi:serine/threonine-protein kinase RsbW
MPDETPPRCEFRNKDLILRLDITVRADVSEIDPVAEEVMSAVNEMGCAAGKTFEIETALREALANAFVHGCGGDPDKEVQVCVSCDEGRGVLIVVRDPGPGFDPASIPSPVMGENIYSEHGRGIYLINRLMDEVTFRKGGTEIHMKAE